MPRFQSLVHFGVILTAVLFLETAHGDTEIAKTTRLIVDVEESGKVSIEGTEFSGDQIKAVLICLRRSNRETRIIFRKEKHKQIREEAWKEIIEFATGAGIDRSKILFSITPPEKTTTNK